MKKNTTFFIQVRKSVGNIPRKERYIELWTLLCLRSHITACMLKKRAHFANLITNYYYLINANYHVNKLDSDFLNQLIYSVSKLSNHFWLINLQLYKSNPLLSYWSRFYITHRGRYDKMFQNTAAKSNETSNVDHLNKSYHNGLVLVSLKDIINKEV